MTRIFLYFIVMCFTINSNAQTVGELFTNTKYSSQEVWWYKPVVDSSKFSFFSYNRFRIDHKNQQQNDYLSYSTLNYDVGKGFSLSTGGFLTKQGFSPIVALNYFYANDIWLINFFPAVEIRQKPNADFLAFVQYRPRLSEKLRLFIQLIATSNFNLRQHNFSEQNLRVGLDYKAFQFGVGFDSRQLTFAENNISTTQNSQHLGIFLRKEF